MQRLRTIKLTFVLVFLAGITVGYANSAGPGPGVTGAPGEDTCRSCHTSFALNDGSGMLTIEGVPATYEPEQTYAITVRIQRDNRTRWGFQVTALDDRLEPAGTLTVIDAQRTQLKLDNGTSYITHRTAGTDAGRMGGTSWSFEWTAPPAGFGVVTFYAAGNAANNNQTQFGDNIFTTFAESAPAITVPPFVEVTEAAGLGAAPGGNAVAWADMDLDGDQDFLVARDGRDLLYRNDGGTFIETGEALGLAAEEPSSSAAWGDADNDGRPDLFVATTAGPRLYRNTPAGFVDVTVEAALPAGPATVGAWVDVDGDGALDLFAGYDAGAMLLRNDGTGTFADVTSETGLDGIAAVTSAAWADYDGDGRVDLFAGRATSGMLYRQNGDGTFDEVAAASGLANANAVRDAVWADYDGDLDLDLFLVSDASVALFSNDGDGTFTNVSASAGLGGPGGSALAIDDSDGDGRLDVLIAEQAGIRLKRFDSTVYEDYTEDAGIARVDGSASTWADYDGDGHVDLLVVTEADLFLWRNPSMAPTVTVRALTDADADTSDAETATDRDALGAIVALDDNNNFATGLQQVRVLGGGGSRSQPPARAVFAVPNGGTVGVRATFADGEGRQATTIAGTAAAVDLGDPLAPVTDSVSYKNKGTGKLNVDGSGYVTNVELVEVNGRQTTTTKYPKKRRQNDGTSTRIVGKGENVSALVPLGVPVRVTTFDPTTGVRSAPVVFVR